MKISKIEKGPRKLLVTTTGIDGKVQRSNAAERNQVVGQKGGKWAISNAHYDPFRASPSP